MRGKLHSKGRILLVGASEDLHEFTEVIYGNGYHVCWATTLKEAVALRTKCCPAMVLVDLRQPSPIALPEVMELRQDLKGEGTLTGLVDGANRQDRMTELFDHLLSAPMSAPELTSFLERLDSFWPRTAGESGKGAASRQLACRPPSRNEPSRVIMKAKDAEKVSD
jgi:DNA-binding response OmpR family regulator